MSTHSGPNGVENNLVFCYDIGNTQHSWKGAPTTNLIYSLGDPSAEYARGEFGQYFNLVAPFESNGLVPYSLSFEAKGNIPGNCRVYMQNGSYTKYSFVYQNITLDTNWQYYKFQNITPSGPTAAWLANTPNDNRAMLATYTTYGSGRNPTLRNIQLEVGTFATPFVNGTRSNTQSLIDLTGNNTITANSLTYNSDGSFSFNGINDNATIPSLNLNNTNYSVEIWFYCNTINRVNGLIGDLQYDWWTFQILSNNKIRCRHKESDALGGPTLVSNTTINSQTWYNVVMTFNTTSGMKLYVNGQLDTSTSNIQPFTLSNRGPQFIGQHRGGAPGSPEVMDGKISVIKIYKNKELSSYEIQQNFNALRGRFGL